MMYRLGEKSVNMPKTTLQKEGFSQKQLVLTFGATFFHWEYPEIVLGSSKEPKSVGEV